jgi:hypothetical protein
MLRFFFFLPDLQIIRKPIKHQKKFSLKAFREVIGAGFAQRDRK